ncbi:MAG: DUF2586 family protein [Bacteroidaceae bacterium]|nr:DUF2586 family protein [Bacteroidaceae bacterium]
MALPRVKISFENGALGGVAPSEDGVCGLVAYATAVSTTFALNTPYLITKLAGLEALGVTSEATGVNAALYKTVKEFYSEAPDGTKLWVMGVAASTTIANLTDKANNIISPLLMAARGSINILMLKVASAAEPTMSGSIDGAVLTAVTNLQALAEDWTVNKYAPFMCLVEALSYNGVAASLPDLTARSDNRVGVVLGDSVSGSAGAAVGLVAGRLAAEPVQRSLARVRSGAIKAEAMYIGTNLAEIGDPDVANDLGYIVPRTFVGKSGYYWSDDHLATEASDDYCAIPRRRVIDKAYRITYKTIVDEVAENVPVNAEGKLAAFHCKGVETSVESAIVNSMTSEGNLGNDPDNASDLGVQCYIDPDQNILATSRLEVNLKVKPHGYSKYIDVKLGFKTA